MLDPTMIILQGDIRQSPTPLYVKANSALKKASMVPMISAAGTLTTIRTVNNLSCYTRRLSRYVLESDRQISLRQSPTAKLELVFHSYHVPSGSPNRQFAQLSSG